MGINKSWQATLSFRKFRDKTHDLSKVYWLQQIGVDTTKSLLETKPPDAHTVKELECSFDFRMFPAKVQDTLSWLDTYMDRNRLYLLVVYTAFLESYLKDITFYYIAAKGLLEEPTKPAELLRLNPIGKAMGAPILDKSSVPAMLKFAGSLFGVNFGKNVQDWTKIYQLRCEVAHNGGIATPELLKRLNDLNLSGDPYKYEMLGLGWPELRSFMKSADEIAALIDSENTSDVILALEAEQMMREMAILNRLPNRNKLWEHMHNAYSIKLKSAHKKRIEKIFY